MRASILTRFVVFLAALTSASFAFGADAPVSPQILKSPDGTIAITINTSGQLSYSVTVDGKPVLGTSQLGLALRPNATLPPPMPTGTGNIAGGNFLANNPKGNIPLDPADVSLGGTGTHLLSVTGPTTVDTHWQNNFGKHSDEHDHYNELSLVCMAYTVNFQIIFRAYDDGVAFRYVLPQQDTLKTFILDKDLTQFTFPANYPVFAGEHRKGTKSSGEWEFFQMRLAEIKPDSVKGIPVLVQTPAAWVAIGESDLHDWAGMWIGGAKDNSGFGPYLTPSADGDTSVSLVTKLAPRLDGVGAVVGSTPHQSSWHVLMLGRDPGKLAESDLIANLATPNQLGDVSYVKAGMSAWDSWWSHDTTMDTATIKRYIQLAADMGWPYQIIDWKWYGEQDLPTSDITKVTPALDMPEVLRFAKEKNVRLWLWLFCDDVDRNDAYLKAFPLYASWGIAGIKIDFMDRNDQDMVAWYEKIAKAAADNKLMVDFHGAYTGAGFQRTYPNQITREGILGNEYNKWSDRVTPEHKATLPFTRFLEGPGDFTPGGMNNHQPSQFEYLTNASPVLGAYNNPPRDGPTWVQGTRANELALFVVYDSPLMVACDSPENYLNPDGTTKPGVDFLKIVPTTWDDTRVPIGVIGQQIVVERRKGADWFVAGLSDRVGHDESIPLDFLGAGAWKVKLWKDAADSDTNAEDIDTQDLTLTSADKLTVHLAPSGGFVAHFVKQ